MRLLLTSGLTLVVVSFATINAGAQTNTIPARASAQATSVQDAAPSADPSRVKFLLSYCRGEGGVDAMSVTKATGTNPQFFSVAVHGIVARGVDLSQDALAKQFLHMGVIFGQKHCPAVPVLPATYTVPVSLRSGDPAAFTDAEKGFEFFRSEDRRSYPGDSVSAIVFNLRTLLAADQEVHWVNYYNAPQHEPARQAAEAAQARQRDAQRQAQSQLEARSTAFAKANGVAHFVTIQQLAVNPFVYQNQVVAIYGEFQQMNSATQGLFSSNDKTFVVSAIPTVRFTQQRSMVMLAGRVLGNIEIKLPVLGPTLVPHLSFVGSAFCQQQGCSEYAFNLR